jgi:hypothetical protein
MPFQYLSIQTAEAHAADQMADADRDRLSAIQAGCPSPEALHLATAVVRRGYILPETMQHPVVKSESINLALLIMAWGLTPTAAACRVARDGADTRAA